MTESVVAPAPAAHYPGKTLGIVGLILAFVISLPAIVVSAVALNESRLAGYRNSYALAGLIVSILFTVLKIVGVVVGLAILFTVLRSCGDWTTGMHVVQNGFSWRCTP